MTVARLVPAVGGTRMVPEPDPIARDYLLLVLRLDQHAPGLVDAYYGPALLKAAVDVDPLPGPARLRDDAAALRERVAAELPTGDRRTWLSAQLVALEARAADLAGAGLPFAELVARWFDRPIGPGPEDEMAGAAAALDEIIPGLGPLDARLDAWDDRLTVPIENLSAVVGWLAARFRESASALFGLPDGEDVTVGCVRNQPWGGYNWYDGGRRSRVDLNVDLPIRAWDLPRLVAHESYPGHHLERAWKEAELVDLEGRLEASVLAINTPECLMSEGLANLAVRFAVSPAGEADLHAELLARAGIIAPPDGSAPEVARLRRILERADRNAAFLRHADGRSREAVVDYLVTVGRRSPERAAKRLDFIDHPLWRTYAVVYAEGESLLGGWLDAATGAGARAARFGRLLREPLTPSQIAAELDGGVADEGVADGGVAPG